MPSVARGVPWAYDGRMGALRDAAASRRPARLGAVLVLAGLAGCGAGASNGTVANRYPSRTTTAAAATTTTAAAAPSTGGCVAGHLTTGQTAGPYFKPGSPARQDIAPAGARGQQLVVTGRVLDPRCRPAAGAVLDFWQASAQGTYDNSGYRFRGHQLTDARGRFMLRTVLPGLYPGRTRHIHVTVRARGGTPLTTQLYFPGESHNDGDGIFAPDLLLTVDKRTRLWRGRFSFVGPVT